MKGNASIQNKKMSAPHKRVYNEWAKAAKKESQTQDAVEKMELEIQGLSMAQNRTHEQDAHLARLRAMLTAKKGELREQGLDTIALKQLLDRFERGKNDPVNNDATGLDGRLSPLSEVDSGDEDADGPKRKKAGDTTCGDQKRRRTAPAKGHGRETPRREPLVGSSTVELSSWPLRRSARNKPTSAIEESIANETPPKDGSAHADPPEQLLPGSGRKDALLHFRDQMEGQDTTHASPDHSLAVTIPITVGTEGSLTPNGVSESSTTGSVDAVDKEPVQPGPSLNGSKSISPAREPDHAQSNVNVSAESAGAAPSLPAGLTAKNNDQVTRPSLALTSEGSLDDGAASEPASAQRWITSNIRSIAPSPSIATPKDGSTSTSTAQNEEQCEHRDDAVSARSRTESVGLDDMPSRVESKALEGVKSLTDRARPIPAVTQQANPLNNVSSTSNSFHTHATPSFQMPGVDDIHSDAGSQAGSGGTCPNNEHDDRNEATTVLGINATESDALISPVSTAVPVEVGSRALNQAVLLSDATYSQGPLPADGQEQFYHVTGGSGHPGSRSFNAHSMSQAPNFLAGSVTVSTNTVPRSCNFGTSEMMGNIPSSASMQMTTPASSSNFHYLQGACPPLSSHNQWFAETQSGAASVYDVPLNNFGGWGTNGGFIGSDTPSSTSQGQMSDIWEHMEDLPAEKPSQMTLIRRDDKVDDQGLALQVLRSRQHSYSAKPLMVDEELRRALTFWEEAVRRECKDINSSDTTRRNRGKKDDLVPSEDQFKQAAHETDEQYFTRMEATVEHHVSKFIYNAGNPANQFIPFLLRDYVRANALQGKKAGATCLELCLVILTTINGYIKCLHHHHGDKNFLVNDRLYLTRFEKEEDRRQAEAKALREAQAKAKSEGKLFVAEVGKGRKPKNAKETGSKVATGSKSTKGKRQVPATTARAVQSSTVANQGASQPHVDLEPKELGSVPSEATGAAKQSASEEDQLILKPMQSAADKGKGRDTDMVVTENSSPPGVNVELQGGLELNADEEEADGQKRKAQSKDLTHILTGTPETAIRTNERRENMRPIYGYAHCGCTIEDAVASLVLNKLQTIYSPSLDMHESWTSSHPQCRYRNFTISTMEKYSMLKVRDLLSHVLVEKSGPAKWKYVEIHDETRLTYQIDQLAAQRCRLSEKRARELAEKAEADRKEDDRSLL